NKLKKHNEEKKKSKDSGSEQAHVTTGNDDKVRHLPYTFDTGASSHMTPYLEDFEHLSLCTGSINSSSSHSLKVEGKGSVVIENVLRDGSVSTFRLLDVLYVPGLDRPLFSWSSIKNKGYVMGAQGNYITVSKDGKTVVEAVTCGRSKLFTIPEVKNSAHLSFEYWHQALGHLAPSSFNKVKDLYSDAAIIPPAPKDFHCSNCIIAKSTHHKPKATPRKERTKFDLIHTDLSGPFPAPSYGGKLYYITLVD